MINDKIRDNFRELTIDKSLVRALGIRDKQAIPSFVEEWLVSRYQSDDNTNEDIELKITEFMSKHLPSKSEKEVIKNRIFRGETVVVLDRFDARVDIKKAKRLVTIPCLDESQALISDAVLDGNESLLEGGQWGAGQLSMEKDGKNNAIALIRFNPMESGVVELSSLVEARKNFTTEEWIQFLMRTMGYEPATYSSNEQRKVILRLLPLLQSNLNMMELAPKGTGKSFIYSNLSRYTWLNSGGALSQAQLFMNMNTKEKGILVRHDLLVLDEGQSISFKGADDIHAKFKDYLESGHFSIANKKLTSDCGLMILANIDLWEGQPRQADYIRHLPEMFHDDALIDRFHGIIPGWEIPRFTTEHAAKGFGMKADVFGQYLHQLRKTSLTTFPFGKPPTLEGDSRDVKAVTKLCAALSKLLLLNPEDADYEEYVYQPAIELRKRVREQLSELNPHEFKPHVNVKIKI
jgi:ATP-dependent Lon protease